MPGMSEHIIHTPDTAMLEQLADRAIRQLPQKFRDHLGTVVFRIADFAEPEALQAVGLTDPWALLGLYHGRPFGQRSIWSSGDMPSVISLFRRPLLAEWHRRGVSLQDMVSHVIIHEIGHHFGLSDADMHAIEDQD